MTIANLMRVLALLMLSIVGLTAMPSWAETSRILEVTGKPQGKSPVLLKRSRWKKYVPVNAGKELYADDLLDVTPGTKVVVLCPDGKTSRRVPTGEPFSLNNLCPGQAPMTRPSGVIITSAYGGRDASIPYVISPRSSSILIDKPLLKWNRVPGVTSYRVMLSSRDGLIWSQRVEGNQVVYPGNPLLRAGIAYSLIVEVANGKSSQEEKGAGSQFNLLDRQQARQIQEQIARLEQQGLSNELKVLYLVDLYRDRKFNLLAEAIAVLENAIAKGNKTPMTQRLLADLYWQVGLKLLAERSYQQAISTAKIAQDIEVQADASFGLGNLYVATEERTQASYWFNQALATYRVLGDDKRVTDLQQRLNQLTFQHQPQK
jgi:hypothetical protein